MSTENKLVKAWMTKAGMPGIIRESAMAGVYCGYVGVGPEHPAFERGYDHPIVAAIDVMGGLGYADRLDSTGWWFGFDTGHSISSLEAMKTEEGRAGLLSEVSKNVELLAVQLAARANLPRAMVYEVDGEYMLDDPDATAMIRAINKTYCIESYNLNKDAIERFVGRLRALGKSPREWVIVVINASDRNGAVLAEILMPGSGPTWQAMRDKGQIPFARGLAGREGITLVLKDIDKDAWKKILELEDSTVVVVVDHDVAEVFKAPPGPNIYGRDLDLSAAKEGSE